MREVACPICTVHLQVQVPASGSETIECGVCQHPFLVSANWLISFSFVYVGTPPASLIHTPRSLPGRTYNIYIFNRGFCEIFVFRLECCLVAAEFLMDMCYWFTGTNTICVLEDWSSCLSWPLGWTPGWFY